MVRGIVDDQLPVLRGQFSGGRFSPGGAKNDHQKEEDTIKWGI